MNKRYRSMLRIRVGVQQERDKWEVGSRVDRMKETTVQGRVFEAVQKCVGAQEAEHYIKRGGV